MGEEGKKSYFNAGMAQADRVDMLQRILNDARFNIMMINPIYGRFNYEVMVTSCDGLLKECWGKLSDKEKAEGLRIKNLISSYLNSNPIVIGNGNGESKVNNNNLKVFQKFFELYENKMRDFLEAHDMNSPNKEEEDDDEL